MTLLKDSTSVLAAVAEQSPLRSAVPRVSVIVPTLNEAENLPHILPLIPGWVDEVVLVDGRSTDGTVEVARRMMPSVRVVLEPSPGKGAALQAGFKHATGDIIVMMDADGSTNPKEIGDFVRALRNGADFVKGSRFLQGAGSHDISAIRRLGNLGLTVMVRLLFGGRYSDLCYGFCGFWRDTLTLLEPDVSGFEIETLLNIRALRSGLRILEVPSVELSRISGQSNLHPLRDGWRILKTILRERVSGRFGAPAQRRRPAVAGPLHPQEG